MLESFQNPELPSEARKRLGVSLLGSALAYGLVAGAIVAATAVASHAHVDMDELIHVELASEPTAAPEPPPPPPPEPVAEKAARQRRRLVVPTKLSDGPLAESDAALAEEEAPPDEVEEAPEAAAAPAPVTQAPAPVAPAPAPRPRPPRPAGPIQLPENATPPVPEGGNRPPAYPEAARSSGVEAMVIAKIVVTESGAVGSIEILRGHPAFDDAVRAALRTWRFTPAMVEGRPTAVYRIIRVPFRLNNL
jgi:protein TonB